MELRGICSDGWISRKLKMTRWWAYSYHVPLYLQAERLSAREVEKDMAKLKQHLDEIQITLRSEKENLQAARRTVGGQWFRHVGFIVHGTSIRHGFPIGFAFGCYVRFLSYHVVCVNCSLSRARAGAPWAISPSSPSASSRRSSRHSTTVSLSSSECPVALAPCKSMQFQAAG